MITFGGLVNTAAKELLFSTVCIEGIDRSGSVISGTCFLVDHEIAGYGIETFLVTNKHVVDGMEQAKLCFTYRAGAQPEIGHTFSFQCPAGFGAMFHGHPNLGIDVTVLPFSFLLLSAAGAKIEAFIRPVSTEAISTNAQAANFDAVLPIIFVGYPNGLYDSVNRTPIVRRGTTATPVELDFDGEPKFLIDASVFPGSSGSPVFAYSETWDGRITDLWLLGILAQVMLQEDSGELRPAAAPTMKLPVVAIRQVIDLGVVIKGHTITETIEDCWNHRGEELRRINTNLQNPNH